MQTTVWTWVGLAAVLALAALAGWVVRGLADGQRLAAERAVGAERMGRLAAELEQARSAAATHAQAPAQVAAAMAPVQTALDRLESAVARAAGGQAGAAAQLAEQLRVVAAQTSASSEGLRRETARLVGALGHSEVRGRWGEFQLRRLLETSGLVRDVHFSEQVTVETDEGRLRPDVVLHLGPDKTVVVDAKVSLRAILAVEAGDPEDELAVARAAHAREVRGHVDRLAGKEYARQFDTAPEFVVMFLPAESLLAEALAWDPTLLEDAFARNVVLATPTTFMALTRTVAHIWRQDVLAENARELQALGRELVERLTVMVGHLDRLGASLGSSVAAYNRAIASRETRVLVTGRRFAGLQGLPEPESPRQLEVTPRAIVAGRPVAAEGEGGPAGDAPGDAAVIDMALREAVVDLGA